MKNYSFPQKLAYLRESKGMTQTDLAEKLKVSKAAVSLWEKGKATPTFHKMIKLEELFETHFVDAEIIESTKTREELSRELEILKKHNQEMIAKYMDFFHNYNIAKNQFQIIRESVLAEEPIQRIKTLILELKLP